MYIADVKERISEVDLRAIFLFIVFHNSLHKTSILKHHTIYNIHGISHEVRTLFIVLDCILAKDFLAFWLYIFICSVKIDI